VACDEVCSLYINPRQVFISVFAVVFAFLFFIGNASAFHASAIGCVVAGTTEPTEVSDFEHYCQAQKNKGVREQRGQRTKGSDRNYPLLSSIFHPDIYGYIQIFEKTDDVALFSH